MPCNSTELALGLFTDSRPHSSSVGRTVHARLPVPVAVTGSWSGWFIGRALRISASRHLQSSLPRKTLGLCVVPDQTLIGTLGSLLPGLHFSLPPAHFVVVPHHASRHKVEPFLNHSLVWCAVIMPAFCGDPPSTKVCSCGACPP